MPAKNLTLEVLKQIRDEARLTNARLDQTNARLESMGTELGGAIESLRDQIVESEVRTATALSDLAGTVRELTVLLKLQADLRPRVEKCEQEIAVLKNRLPDA